MRPLIRLPLLSYSYLILPLDTPRHDQPSLIFDLELSFSLKTLAWPVRQTSQR